MRLVFTAIAATLLAGPATAATTITFDDRPSTATSIPNGYAGLNWSNFRTADPTTFTPPTSGYTNGRVSAPNIALNGFSDPATISSDSGFSLISGYLTGAWNDGLTVQLDGYLGASLVYSVQYIVDTIGPSFINFNNAWVDSVTFSSFGGVDAGLGGIGEHFALDNLTFSTEAAIPEPATWAMLIAGFSMIGMAARRRRMAMA